MNGQKALNIRFFFVLFFALVFTIIPLPEAMNGFRPPWVLFVILYIQFFLPSYFNFLLLFFLGLCLDVLQSTVIGEHTFALLLTTWFAVGKVRRFTFFSMAQQIILIALFCFSYQLILYLIDAFLGYNNELPKVVGTAFLSTLLWPWLRLILDRIFSVYSQKRFE